MTLHPLESLTLADYVAPRPPEVPQQARSLALGIAQAVAETLSGRRSPHQFIRWLSPLGCQEVTAWVRATGRADTHMTRCHLVMVDTHIEGCLTFNSGDRTIAVALRLDDQGNGWACQQLQVLLPGRSL